MQSVIGKNSKITARVIQITATHRLSFILHEWLILEEIKTLIDFQFFHQLIQTTCPDILKRKRTWIEVRHVVQQLARSLEHDLVLEFA